MHGIIMVELGKFVEARLGAAGWTKLLADAGLSGRFYVPIEEYPDAEAMTLIAGATQALGMPQEAVVEEFGKALVPGLVKLFGHLIPPTWKTLDLIAHTEDTIHQSLRRTTKKVQPPALKTTRPSADEVVVTYASKRRLCSLAKGIVQGVARHYGERVTITEPQCMHKGDAACEIVVRLEK